MRILQTTELKKYYGTEPDITRALDGVTLSIETLQTFITGIDTPFAEGGSHKKFPLNSTPNVTSL